MVRVANVALIIFGALLLAGCSTAGPTVLHDEGRAAVVSSPQNVSGGAALFGTLALDSNGCWGLADADGNFHAVMWPSGTTIASGRIQLPGHTSQRSGAKVTGGGGAGTAPAVFDPCMSKGEDVTYLDTIDAG